VHLQAYTEQQDSKVLLQGLLCTLLQLALLVRFGT
jgi:hypothetical protein